MDDVFMYLVDRWQCAPTERVSVCWQWTLEGRSVDLIRQKQILTCSFLRSVSAEEERKKKNTLYAPVATAHTLGGGKKKRPSVTTQLHTSWRRPLLQVKLSE